jgi:MFS family permease
MEVRKKGLRRATLLFASSLTVMAGAIIAPALPQISSEFTHVAGYELLSRLVLTLPALFMAILAPFAGYLLDSRGRRNILLYSLILYAIGGTSGLYLNDLYAILLGRALLGIATGALVTSVITLIGDYYEGSERSSFMGVQAAFSGLGGLIFISSGGILADIHWRLPFLIYILSLGVFAMAAYSIYEPKKERVLLSDVQIPNNKIIISPVVYGIYAVAFFSAIIFYMIPTQMPFMLNAMEGVTNTGIGFAIAFINVASVTTSLNYARMKKKFNFRIIMVIIYLLVFMGFLIISQAKTYFMMILGIAVSGFGFGMMFPNLNLWLISLAPPALRGRLVGFLNSALFFGMFFSPIAIQPLINLSGLYGSFMLMGFLAVLLSVVLLSYGLLTRSNL